MNWDDYDVFCHVIEQGGFSAAARETGRPKSTISAAIARLEEALGMRLLERTTRQMRATDAGDSLYHGIGPLFIGLREARADALAQGEAIAGTLRIAAPYEFGAHHLGPVACELMARYPRLKVRLDVEHEPVNPLEKRYDIAFAMLESGLPGSSVVQRRMFSLERGVYAAPALLERQGTPKTPQALAEMPLLCGAADMRWTFTHADGSSESVAVPTPRLHSGNANVRLQAAIAGLGVARITATFCEEAVQAGRLRRLLPGLACEPLRVYALLPARRLMPAKVRMFLDALGRQAGVAT
ncbi:MAG: LysR family transcriptional regulator [Burkholderiales bacterium]|nr:LysR family transcriptional regulator [Burkholderiales bacterium]